jgi:S-adenosylmethionine decarboxylase
VKHFLTCIWEHKVNTLATVTEQKTIFGDHYLVDLHGCNPDLISAVETVRNVLLDAAVKSKSTIIDDRFHQFEPYGASGVIIIAESHFSVHTWPEKKFAAVDIFTSGTRMKPQLAIDIMKAGYGADHVNVVKVARGCLSSLQLLRDGTRGE